METSYQEFRKKEVVNLNDGKKLGRVCDIIFTYPEGKVRGIVVPESRHFFCAKADVFVDLRNIKKVGVDVILVELHRSPPSEPPCGEKPRRDMGECE